MANGFYQHGDKIIFKKAVLIGFILGLAPALTGAASALTLQEALAQTRENLPSYQAAKNKVESADALYGAALGSYLPSLDASAFRDRHDVDRADYYSSSGYDVTLSYRLFDGKRRASRDIAGFNLEMEREELRKNLLELDYRVKVAFYTALAGREVLDQRKVQLEDAGKDYEVAEGRRSLGAARLSEALQASVRLEQARFNVVQAEGNLRKALSELYSLIGRPEETEGNAEGRLDAGGTVPELKALSDAVLARPEIRQAEIALKKTEQEISNLGNNLIIVLSGQIRRYGPNIPLISRATNLTQGDAEAIANALPAAARVSPSGFKAFPVRRGDTVLKAVAVNGVTPDFGEVRNFEIAEGSPITEEDDRLQRKVALIGRTTAEKLFGEENPVGKTILIWRVPCQIIGVMAEKGTDLAGNDQDNRLFIPLKTFLRDFVNQENVNIIYIQAVSAEAIEPLRGEIEALLRVRHGIRKEMKDDFGVVDLKEVTALKSRAMDLITVLGRIAAAASFLIGALGILSIMILIVNERRVEIGIRRAVGSRKRDIILQFLMESSFISVGGGIIGMAAGFLRFLMSLAIARVLRYPVTVSGLGLLVAFAASALSGIVAGIYPSFKATQIHPVDIIREI